MGNPMMTDKNPNDVKEWSPEHVKKHLEEHITSSKYDNNLSVSSSLHLSVI